MRPRADFKNFVSTPFKSEVKTLEMTQALAHRHSSGGSYNMICYSSRNFLGRNKIARSSNRLNSMYPIEAGLHAELDVWRQSSLHRSTVWIAGSNAKSHNPMANTAPCIFCLLLLINEGTRHVVFYLNSRPVKLTLNKLPNFYVEELTLATGEYSWGL